MAKPTDRVALPVGGGNVPYRPDTLFEREPVRNRKFRLKITSGWNVKSSMMAAQGMLPQPIGKCSRPDRKRAARTAKRSRTEPGRRKIVNVEVA